MDLLDRLGLSTDTLIGEPATFHFVRLIHSLTLWLGFTGAITTNHAGQLLKILHYLDTNHNVIHVGRPAERCSGASLYSTETIIQPASLAIPDRQYHEVNTPKFQLPPWIGTMADFGESRPINSNRIPSALFLEDVSSSIRAIDNGIPPDFVTLFIIHTRNGYRTSLYGAFNEFRCSKMHPGANKRQFLSL